MSLLEALEEANNSVKGIKGLSFANLQEFSSFQDSFKFPDWPRNIVMPPNLNGVLKNNRRKEIIDITGFMVTRINQDTNDYRSVKIEPDYIAPMREAARTFINKLANSDLTDPEVENISYSIGSEYQWLSSHLFGVVYTMKWPVNLKIC